MRRYVLPLLLLLSLGINIGLVVDRLGGKNLLAGKDRQSADLFDGASLERPIPPRLIRMLERMAVDLSLEGKDHGRFLELQRHFFSRSIALRDQTRQAQRALRQELLSETPNRERAVELLRLANESQAAIELEFVDNFFETRQLLETPEQLKRFRRFMVRVRQLRQEMERRFDDRRGQRFENRRGRRLEDRRGRKDSAPPPESPSP